MTHTCTPMHELARAGVSLRREGASWWLVDTAGRWSRVLACPWCGRVLSGGPA